MLGSLGLVIALAGRKGRLARNDGVVLLMAYPAYTVLVLLT